MKINKIIGHVTDKTRFQSLGDYIDFCQIYLDFIHNNLQAVIVAQNETQYQFYQYKEEANFQITRPINASLMYNIATFEKAIVIFRSILTNLKSKEKVEMGTGIVINRTVYTIQQSIGAALDALSSGRSNTARKLNGDLFERLIRLIIKEIGFECRSGVLQIPVLIDDQEAFKMSYQHDLILEKDGDVKMFGSVKTSSKDRLDKIFVDKFLYNRLTETSIPHIAIFLNDVQRKNTKRINEYGINSTFLPGHFKGYTIKLNPLDGVYYCDIRPNMISEPILRDHIKTFDKLIFEDIWMHLS